MNAYRILVLSIATVSCLAYADVATGFLGSWKVLWTDKARGSQEARLVIHATGGTWKATTRRGGKNVHCDDLGAPISIIDDGQNTMTIKIKFSEALPGCTDSTLTLKMVDEKSAVGTRDGLDLALAKE